MEECLNAPTVSSTQESEVYLRVWDCGGQPVYLNILSAFLTARTLFLLMFDARQDLNKKSLHLSHCRGRASKQVDGMTNLELIVQWMTTIHATLLKKQSFVNEYKGASKNVEKYPKILLVGTHGDDTVVKEKLKDDIFRPLKEVCANKAFSHLLLKSFVVDNTTAGKGDIEDPAFCEICKIAEDFASTNLAIPTPITWVLFRRVFERHSRGKPVVPLDEVVELATACSIPAESVSSVLAFYHELSVFFHYTNIPSLADKIIASPQWLIKQMAKISPLKGFEEVSNELEDLWALLRSDGILVEKLYNHVFRSQEGGLTPQAIVDLLEHFLIISQIDSRKRHPHKGLEYFVPSILPLCTSRSPETNADCIKSANPIHIIFSTNYLPPGFFVRLVTVFSKHEHFHINFSGKLYSNVMKFHYGSPECLLDNVTLMQRESSISIQIHRVHRREMDCPFFNTSCHNILGYILPESVKEVQYWFPGIEVSLAVECKGSSCPKGHLVPLPSLPSKRSTPTVTCQKSFSVKLAPAEFWFYTEELVTSNGGEDSNLSDLQLDFIYKKINEPKVAELTEELEMTELTSGTDGDVRLILARWQREMKGQGIPAYPHLLMHLRRINMDGLCAKLQFDEIYAKESSQALQPQAVPDPNLSIPSTTSSSTARSSSAVSSGNNVKSPKELLSKQDFAKACEVLQPYAHKWKLIGQHLGFIADELSLIVAAPTHHSDAPQSYLTAMLSSWQQWAPGDSRGSTSYATLDSLRIAVDKAGLGLTAQEL